MAAFWQNVLVICVVLAAAVYIGRRVWRWAALKKSGNCWICSQNRPPANRRELVSITPRPQADDSRES